ncbi:MAG TPA: hypothetical protein ENL17_03140 [Candidatus Methanoperedenaceae archaeon]|nr:hypothetical protein [Candidatus Methanoperedenaceae archaeon]
MGLLDSFFGKTKLPESKTEGIFAVSTAQVTMEANLELLSLKKAGICFKPQASSHFERARQEVEELLELSSKDTNTSYQIVKDDYGYVWILLEDPDFEDLVSNIYLVSEGLVERGFGGQLLCALFPFKSKDKKVIYWVYSFKHGNFYPFAPKPGKERDTALEFRTRSVMEKELPLEGNSARWYPLWDSPL